MQKSQMRVDQKSQLRVDQSMMPHSECPETENPLHQAEVLPGSVHAQYKQCGRACHCKEGREHMHVTYAHFWRERGRLRKRFLRSAEVESARAACERRRTREREQRQRVAPAKAALRVIRHTVREVQRLDRVIG